MTGKRVPLRQADIARALRGAKASGVAVTRVEIEGSKIVLVTDAGQAGPPKDDSFDAWKAKQNARPS
jgi:hypothetical protein